MNNQTTFSDHDNNEAPYKKNLHEDNSDLSFSSDSEKISPHWSQRLPSILRGIGAIAILCSLYSFLMRGWEGSDDLMRFLMLLGHTGILAIIGLSSGYFLKEGKGARLLFKLALVSVVVNFSILGAFIYAEVASVSTSSYPTYLAWSLHSVPAAIFSTLGTLLILVPVIILGFRILSRGMSKQMSVLYLLVFRCLQEAEPPLEHAALHSPERGQGRHQ